EIVEVGLGDGDVKDLLFVQVGEGEPEPLAGIRILEQRGYSRGEVLGVAPQEHVAPGDVLAHAVRNRVEDEDGAQGGKHLCGGKVDALAIGSGRHSRQHLRRQEAVGSKRDRQGATRLVVNPVASSYSKASVRPWAVDSVT